MDRTAAAETFGKALNGPSGVDLVRAAVAIALVAYPVLDIDDAVRRFDEFAAEVAAETGRTTGTAAVEALNQALFVRRGFRGNTAHYADPRNCYVHEVLARKTGLPITLSLLYVEVGRRMGMTVAGVGFPDHFIVRVDTGERDRIYIDPFHGGIELSRADLAALLSRIGGDPERQLDMFLAAVTPRQILTRLLNNLKGMYIHQANYVYARGIVNLMLVLTPWALEEIRDRGLLSGHLGDIDQAGADLDTYLATDPPPADAPRIRERLLQLREQRP